MPNAASTEIEGLRAAHDRLTAAYVGVHRAAEKSRLVRPIVDEHLRRRTRTLHDAYLHAAETVFPQEADQQWLTKEADALQRLESTFRWRWALNQVAGGANMVFGLPGVIGLLSATGISASAIALLNGCLCQLVSLVPLWASLAVFVTFSSAFFDKRKLFLATDAGVKNGVYGAEDEVFKALGIEKEPERAVDLNGWLLITAIWVVAILVEEAATSRHLFYNSRDWLFWVCLGVAVVMSVVSFFRARRRKPA